MKYKLKEGVPTEGTVYLTKPIDGIGIVHLSKNLSQRELGVLYKLRHPYVVQDVTDKSRKNSKPGS